MLKINQPIRLTGFKAIHIEPPRTVVKATTEVDQAREGLGLIALEIKNPTPL